MTAVVEWSTTGQPRRGDEHVLTAHAHPYVLPFEGGHDTVTSYLNIHPTSAATQRCAQTDRPRTGAYGQWLRHHLGPLRLARPQNGDVCPHHAAPYRQAYLTTDPHENLLAPVPATAGARIAIRSSSGAPTYCNNSVRRTSVLSLLFHDGKRKKNCSRSQNEIAQLERGMRLWTPGTEPTAVARNG